ncbi:fumarate reductase cytochrome b subunit [Shewanella sp. AS16]|uniref:fumarate reductase cytochrome b subunit n=1 Tax=Shewanella sp. AS16 TaxID=2907625 RepID=UPI001F2F9B01|nr:fumarate reductase cytochrome b subunit [Shewanella sp. AS16]MCE9685960.1 fumarate reductase cytochrome b subunit [Shewanella sp. AS16]
MAKRLKMTKWYACLDVCQSLSGVLLAVFLWTHLLLVSSILLGGEAMAWVARTMELSFLSADGQGYPWVVSLIAIGVAGLALVHAVPALQKMPLTLRQHAALRTQMHSIDHGDTRLWYWQALTGGVILLLLPVHLWLIGSAPETIGPQGSGHRIWAQGVWLLYLPLLLAVELHAAIGIYRVVLKWGAARGLNTRIRLKKLKTLVSLLFIAIGLASLLAFLPYATLAG